MKSYLRIAVPSPLYQLFDYLPPAGDDGPFRPGMRVRVPFGRGRTVGVLAAITDRSDVDAAKLKRVSARLDETPLLPPDLMRLADWAAAYYHHPIGEVLATMLPVALRQGGKAAIKEVEAWTLTADGRNADPDAFKRAPKQAAIIALLQAHPEGLPRTALELDGRSALAPLRALQQKGLITRGSASVKRDEGIADRRSAPTGGVLPALNDAQQAAVTAVTSCTGFGAFLLDGVTGSGKTEVYLHAIQSVLDAGKQALVLVPEIALTPQLVARFNERFPNVPMVALHSALNDSERMDAWLRAQRGLARIVIGTRSAVFTPMPEAGLIVVDEEHDGSFKQQEGLRYSARDMAVWRARELDVPVVLGSATPSLESLLNVRNRRYQSLSLPERAGTAAHPAMHLIDLRGRRLHHGLCEDLLGRMQKHLEAGNQVLLFLNRRGYAPVLQCHDCGWISVCSRCDSRMTLHREDKRLQCHHCGHQQRIPERCPTCAGEQVQPVGLGTERLEETLAERFPDAPMVRIDRDATRRKGSLDKLLAKAESGEARILVGTQMLAKGHHFPGVTMVGVVDADGGLYSADFRASERMAQLILQVAGRAGRADKPGEVMIQTHCPDHPLLLKLVHEGYPAFAAAALAEREIVGLPPFAHIAMLRAEATGEDAPAKFLEAARELAHGPHAALVSYLGPIPAPMARRAGRYRAQAMIRAPQRSPLQRCLGQMVPKLSSLPEARKVRWSIDVDPADTY